MANGNPLDKIEHVVVLMLENRSFDNLLGWLYDPANDAPFNVVPPDFEGLYGKNLSNPAPDARIVPAGKTEDPRSPQPNPGEPFEDVYSQIYDVPRPEFKDCPGDAPGPATMQGFIRNYAAQKDAPADPATIMQSLTPKTLPVLSSLAHNYALCDHWFASIPTQTFCNRSFVHAGTSSGYVNNGGGGPVFVNDTPTIFDLLESAGKSWNVFVGGWLLQSFTLLTQRHMWKYALTKHFAHFKDFLAAAANKSGLPAYSFIEPIYFDSLVWGPENDAHPECNPYQFDGPSNLHRAEALVATIYDAIRNSPDWESTLLIVMFDEHGGCYDHVPPPDSSQCDVAIAPDKIIPAGQQGGIGFKFDRLGPRVPAIIISAYTPSQTRLHQIFEHTSILSTIVNCFNLPTNKFGNRQAKALDVSAALTLPTARQDRPSIPMPKFSLIDDVAAEWHSLVHGKLSHAKQKPITDLQRAALHAVALHQGDGELHERVSKLENELEADILLIEQEAKLVKDKVFKS
jgi:phospholipase C